jgi:hypothetical protein
VEEMRRAIHHVELNEKLQDCFDLLDQITKTYRNYNVEYIKIVEAHPQTMDTFFVNFEKDCMSQFRMLEESKRDEILALFTKETEERQKKLEEEALKKYEEEKRLEEAKRILHTFHFVGLTEYWDISVCLAHFMSGHLNFEPGEFINVRPGSASEKEKEKERSELLKLMMTGDFFDWADHELYNEGKKIFLNNLKRYMHDCKR